MKFKLPAIVTDHLRGLRDVKWTGDRFANAYVLFRMRRERGLSHIGQFQSWITQAATFVPTMLLLHIPLIICIFFAIGYLTIYLLLCYVVGYYDMKKWYLIQRESKLSSTELNPVMDKMRKDIEEIKVMLQLQNKTKKALK